MAFVPLANALVLLQLSLLISCISTPVYGDNYHPPAPSPAPVKPPVQPPVKPPTKPPVYPPVKPPTKPPVHPPVKPPTPPPASPPSYPPVKPPPVRKLLAVQGVVFCKSCKYKGIDTLMNAAPLPKAVVKLQCNNTKYGLVEQTKTDKNGYFLFTPQKVTTMAFHKCKVFLVSSPVAHCNVSTNLRAGIAGAILIPDPKPPVTTSLYQYFNVGPFAFEPSKKCHY
ncbi:pistil-specific extensin-like protein [Phtheirospermum japonicum]|uniref:Pistil-specific extensin-like protein n=1 Tax=Phtheirospermum japonicum TaxID=374723 RepID=A0A830CB31_9LAMI|nr:pistil-specific extensin-like protein [Phtheirospermum japonicum]